MRTTLILAALLAACHPQATTGTARAMIATPAPGPNAQGVYDPADFGAVPFDGGDDRPAIEAAIKAAGDGNTVKLGCGRWTLSTRGTVDRFASLELRGKNVTLAGSGPCTTIAVTGDAGLGTWWIINVTAADHVTLRDFTLDTSGLYNTEEQTHAIQVLGPANETKLDGVTIIHPRPGTNRVGDCVRLLGNGAVLNPDGSVKTPAALVTNTTIMNTTFSTCARDGVGVQRGVWNLTLIGDSFYNVIKGSLHFEPTAVGGNGNVIVVGNQFMDAAGAITLSGYDNPVNHVVFSGNLVAHHGVLFYRARNVVFSGNDVDCDNPLDASACVDFDNLADKVDISDNHVHRGAGDGTPATAGLVIRTSHHGTSAAATRVILHHNFLSQDSASSVVDLISASDVTVDHNDITYSAPTTWTQGFLAIAVHAIAYSADMIDVDDNRIRATTPGSLNAAVFVGVNDGMTVGVVHVHDNLSINVDQGFRCGVSGTGHFTEPVTYAGNHFAHLGHGILYSCPSSVAAIIDQVQ